MATLIVSNGSKWAGDALDTIEDFARRLETNILHPMFLEYGAFVHETEPHILECLNDPSDWSLAWKGGVLVAPGPFAKSTVSFFGNFWDVSHVFNIFTDDQKLIDRLVALIRANCQTVEFFTAKDEHAQHKRDRIAQEKRARHSIQQRRR